MPRRKARMPKWVAGLLATLFWLAIWAALALAVRSPLLLPAPWTVAAMLARLLGTSDYWLTVLATLGRTATAFLCGVAGGVLLAAATHASSVVDAMLAPALRVIRATPVPSFIILALVWMSASAVPVLIGALMVLPIVWGQTAQALAAVDPKLIEMARMYRFSRGKTLRAVTVPSILPALLAACETSLGLCWKACVAAEVLAVTLLSIGGKLRDAKIYLETDALLAWTVTVILLSVLIERALRWGARRWARGGREA